jgi:hypothetical protein
VRTRLVLTTAAMLLLGVAAGFVWVWLAHPAEWEVNANGIVLTEAAAKGQFSVIVVFVLIGVVASFLWAWFAVTELREIGWLITPLVIVATLLAAVIAWRLGVQFGPADPRSVAHPAVGDMLPSKLAIDGVPPFLAWPIFGLLGVLWAGSWDRREAEQP